MKRPSRRGAPRIRAKETPKQFEERDRREYLVGKFRRRLELARWG